MQDTQTDADVQALDDDQRVAEQLEDEALDRRCASTDEARRIVREVLPLPTSTPGGETVLAAVWQPGGNGTLDVFVIVCPDSNERGRYVVWDLIVRPDYDGAPAGHSSRYCSHGSYGLKWEQALDEVTIRTRRHEPLGLRA